MVFQKIEVFQAYHKDEKGRGKSSLQVTGAAGKQDARYNHMEDKVKDERILYAPGKMDERC